MVHSSISIFEFVRGGTGGEGEELVAEADSKDWFGRLECEGVFDGFDRGVAHGGVAWSVGDEEAFPLNVFRVLFQVVVEWDDRELYVVCLDEVADDVVFHTTIVGDDFGAVAFSVGGDYFG